MPSREAAQLEISGLGRHMAVKRAGEEKKEADWSEAGDAICAPSGDAGVPAGHHGRKLLSGLDRFRVRRRCAFPRATKQRALS